MRRRSSTSKEVLKGAIAGAVATWTLDQITTWLYRRESRPARQQEDRARHGRTAYEVAAERVAGALGRELDQRGRRRLGQAIHWALGVGAGVAYSTVGRRIPGVRRGGGGAFGTAFWATVDEGLVTLLGLTPSPTAFPWQTHARGFSGHLAFGIVTDQTLRVLDAVT